ncbi:MAG TPA: hypothetical protein VIF12_02855 [Micavibrio sp.]
MNKAGKTNSLSKYFSALAGGAVVGGLMALATGGNPYATTLAAAWGAGVGRMLAEQKPGKKPQGGRIQEGLTGTGQAFDLAAIGLSFALPIIGAGYEAAQLIDQGADILPTSFGGALLLVLGLSMSNMIHSSVTRPYALCLSTIADACIAAMGHSSQPTANPPAERKAIQPPVSGKHR